jgi:hypothetical protein
MPPIAQVCCLQKPGLNKPGFFMPAKKKGGKDGNNACFKNTVVADKAYTLYIRQSKQK